MVNLVLLGPAGAGKGTQAVNLAEIYDIPHISTGDIFRKHIKEGTELGKQAKEYMDKGALVPDGLVVEIVKTRFLEGDCDKGFVLDGFPRTVHQAEALKNFFKGLGWHHYKVIHIYVEQEELVERIAGRRLCKDCGRIYHIVNMPPKKEGICDKCGGEVYQRSDDNAETVVHRMEVYNTETMPLIDHYDKMRNIIHINGKIGRVKVFKTIMKAVEILEIESE